MIDVTVWEMGTIKWEHLRLFLQQEHNIKTFVDLLGYATEEEECENPHSREETYNYFLSEGLLFYHAETGDILTEYEYDDDIHQGYIEVHNVDMFINSNDKTIYLVD